MFPSLELYRTYLQILLVDSHQLVNEQFQQLLPVESDRTVTIIVLEPILANMVKYSQPIHFVANSLLVKQSLILKHSTGDQLG